MKNYKRILAGLLAINLTIGAMPTGMMTASASTLSQKVETTETMQEDAALETEAEENTDAVDKSEENNGENTAEDVESGSASASDSAGSEKTDDLPENADQNETEDTTENTDEPDTDDAAENTDEKTEENVNSDSQEEKEEKTTEDTETENSEEEIAVQAISVGSLKLKDFKDYKGNNQLTVSSAKALILLSYCDPAEIQNLEINLQYSGGCNLKEDAWDKDAQTKVSDIINTSETDFSGMVYQGLGNEQYPFKGEINGTCSNLDVDKTFFGGLSSEATISVSSNSYLNITWYGDGSMPMIAKVYQFDSDKAEGHTLPVHISGNSAATLGNLIGAVKAGTASNQILNIDGQVITYGTNTVKVDSSTENAGLICNTLENGTICLTDYVFPASAYTVLANGSGAAGGIIGQMQDNTILKICTSASIVSSFDKTNDNTKAQTGIYSKNGNAGGLVGSLEKDAKIVTEADAAITFQNAGVTGKLSSGGLVGSMAEGARVELNAAVTFTAVNNAANLEVTSTDQAAGGIAGTMESGAKIVTGKDAVVCVSDSSVADTAVPKIKGGTAAGGVVGEAENVTFEQLESEIQVCKPEVNGSKAGANAGGFIGTYTLDNSDSDSSTIEKEQRFPDEIVIESPTVWINGAQSVGDGNNAGGYFGILKLLGEIHYKVGPKGEEKKHFESTYKNNGGYALGYGSIAGIFYSSEIESSLTVQNMEIKTTSSGSGARPAYNGGLVGRVGDAQNSESDSAYMEVNNVDLNTINPHAGWLFGGVAAYLTQGSILKVQDVSISTQGSSDPSIWEGGGILGKARPGSVLELSGVTDLTNAYFQGNGAQAATTVALGQIVKENDSGLIYARGDGNGEGWIYKRCNFSNLPKTGNKASAFVNDIGTYGQVIRLKSDENTNGAGLSSDLITITPEEHKVVLKGPSKAWSSSTIELSSADDFALLSIAWNSRGYHSADSNNINKENYGTLYSRDIKLSSSIDLTGTGITGLTRDTSDESAYTGTLSGTGTECVLTLSTGETFGFQNEGKASDGTDGCGKIYSYVYYSNGVTYNNHNYQGIFARMQGNVKDLKISGNIYVSNAASDMKVGGIAAEVSASGKQVSNTIAAENITVDAPKTAQIVVGGLYGHLSSGGGDGLILGAIVTGSDTSVREGFKTEIKANIKIQNCTDETTDTKIFAGSAIGWGTGGFKVQCNDLKIGGKIESDEKKKAYVGGMIGIITGTNDHWLEIRKLVYDDFSIEAPEATEMCGGLLGAIWSHVGAYFMIWNGKDGTDTKLIIQNAEINAPQAENIGGLAYRSSGTWEIRAKGIDMQKLTIKGGKNIGLLVEHGEKAEEEIGSTKQELGALYLNTIKYWDDETNFAYKMNTDAIDIQATDESGVFDEFVAYTASSADAISKNGQNGIVSIATESEGSSRVSVSLESCKTYQNRTDYGKKHQTNNCSRYYYDLDKWLEEATKDTKTMNNGQVDSPQELLLWSVYHYAEDSIKSYFKKVDAYDVPDVEAEIIGSSSTPEVEFDMEKYSYYPINLDGSVDVKNAIITFHNLEIEVLEKKAANKSTVAAETSARTQHDTMHCALFLNHTNYKAASTVNVENVKFCGTIGKVSDSTSSGVLFAGYAAGDIDNQTVYTAVINIQCHLVKLISADSVAVLTLGTAIIVVSKN